MDMTVALGGLVGFDWIFLGLGVFADMATNPGKSQTFRSRNGIH